MIKSDMHVKYSDLLTLYQVNATFRLDHGPYRLFIEKVPFSLLEIIARERLYAEFGHDHS